MILFKMIIYDRGILICQGFLDFFLRNLLLSGKNSDFHMSANF